MVLSPPPNLPSFLLLLLTGIGKVNKVFHWSFLRVSANASVSLANVCMNADWVCCGPCNFTLDPAITSHGMAHRCICSMLAVSDFSPLFLSIHTHDTGFVTEGDVRAAQISNFNPEILSQQTSILLDRNQYVRYLSAKRLSNSFQHS